jgi:hypothetical protein
MDVAESCFTSVKCEEAFQAVKKAPTDLHCTYICVTEQEGLQFLSKHLTLIHVTSLPFPLKDLRMTASKIGEKVVEECHPGDSSVGGIDCQPRISDTGEAKHIIEDHRSGLHIAVRMLVLPVTYSFSQDDVHIPEGTMVITSLDKFRRVKLVSAGPGSQAVTTYYFNPELFQNTVPC